MKLKIVYPRWPKLKNQPEFRLPPHGPVVFAAALSDEIEFVVIEGEEFGPKLIEKLSKEWKIPKNFMFIGSPGDHFLYGLAELGGVRLIV